MFPSGIPPNKMKKLFTKTTPSFGARYLLRAEKYSLLYLFTKSMANIIQIILFKQVLTEMKIKTINRAYTYLYYSLVYYM